MDQGYTEQYETFELAHWWFVVRRQIIEQALDEIVPSLPQPPRWLDVGCGSGVLLNSYDRITKADKVGIDMDGPSVERAKSKGLDARQTSTEWDFSALGDFSLITLCDVIEHVKDETPAVDEVARRLKPGGSVLVTVPALKSLWSSHDELNHHFRRYRKGELLSLFNDPRWEVTRCTYFSSLLLPAIWSVRRLKRLRGSNGEASHDFKFGPKLIDNTLRGVFGLERPWLKRLSFPAGSSLLLVARRTEG